MSQQVDPIKLNQTLTATAEGARRARRSVRPVDRPTATTILADVNPQMPQTPPDNQGLANLGDVYANAAPDLFDGLEHAVTTARTLNEQQGNIDQALMASVGFGNTGGEIFERAGPTWCAARPTWSPPSNCSTSTARLFCTIRNFHDVSPRSPRRLAATVTR